MTDQKRPYRMKKRAELEEATRRRITESAVALHGTVGPARTSISALAEHAGVRRSTVYRHFPDEASLFAACTAHWAAENPVPDIGAWAGIEDPDERLRAALAALYPYYRRTAGMMENLIRDEPVSEMVARALRRLPRLHRGRARGAAARPAPRAGGRARASAPRSATRSPSRRGARWRSTRASTTRRRSSSWRGWWLLAMSASSPARLVTIPISHYCEKARWALDRAGIAYREERHVQIVHRVASRRAGGGGTVPVLVAPEGVFAQSADILAYADRHTEPGARLYPEEPALRAEVVAARARLRRRPRPRGPALDVLPHPAPRATSGAPTTARACPPGSGARSR